MVCSFVPALDLAPHQSRGSHTDTCGQVKRALDDSLQIKTGMTRREVEKQFEDDGGIQAREQTRYVSKKCPYIQVEIHFKLIASNNSLDFSPDDIVAKVSKPYLAYLAVD
jgi:hypothetical protein